MRTITRKVEIGGMRKVNRAKRRKIGVWGGVAVLATAAIGGDPNGGSVATANATGGATSTGAASRLEAAAREDAASCGFWPRLGSDAIPVSGFNEYSGFVGVLTDGGGNDKTPTRETSARGSVESANFVGYSARSDFGERGNWGGDRTRLVDWTVLDGTSTPEKVPTGNANRTFESTAPVATLGENGETAKIGEKNEDGGGGEGETTASRPKTPILRDEPTLTTQGGGSLGSALVSTFGALAVVLGAFFALVAFLKRTGSKTGGGSALEIVDSLAVGDKARLLTIRWGNRLILAAKTPEKIAPLAEIGDVDEANALLAEIERRKETASNGNIGGKTTAIWERGRDAASVWRTAFGTKGRRR